MAQARGTRRALIDVVNPDILAAKLAELQDRIHRVRAHCPATAAELGDDRDALDLVSFNLMLAVQTCADIASHLIADEGWAASKTLAGAFERLRERGVLSKRTAAALASAVGLRNVVAHGYSGVDPAIVHTAATNGAVDLETFAQEVAGWFSRLKG